MAEMNAENWYEDGVATFGDRLEAARLAAGLSEADLSERLGVQYTTVLSWEADEFEPRGNRLQMLAGMLNVSLVWLMTGKGQGVPDISTAPLLPIGARNALARLTELRQQMQELSVQMLDAEQKLALEMRELVD
jgi:transcriptional regulator with XRE-family HTH domain